MSKRSDDQIRADCEILRDDPGKFVDLMNRRIQEDPKDSSSYFSRHQGWLRLGREAKARDDFDTEMKLKCKAIEDLDAAIALKSNPVHNLSRGKILASLGRH